MQIQKKLTKLVENYSFIEYFDESSSKSLKNAPYMSTGGHLECLFSKNLP